MVYREKKIPARGGEWLWCKFNDLAARSKWGCLAAVYNTKGELLESNQASVQQRGEIYPAPAPDLNHVALPGRPGARGVAAARRMQEAAT